MAKTKHHSASAAQRREQARQQRQQRVQAGQNTRGQGSGRRRAKKTSPWPMLGVILLVVLIAVGVIAFIASRRVVTTDTATPEVWNSVTTTSPETLAKVANGSADEMMGPAFAQTSETPLLKGPNGKPEVFYMGAEYCPWCGGVRWSMIVALSQFGTFGGPLEPVITAEGNVPTYTFHEGTYTSEYIDFVPVEVNDNTFPNPKELETLTPEQQQLVSTYNTGGSVPFLSIGNQYIASGGIVDISHLTIHDYATIANLLKDPDSETAQTVLGAANYLTAAICTITENKPENVCKADPVPQMQILLRDLAVPQAPAAQSNSESSSTLALSGLPEIAVRRRE